MLHNEKAVMAVRSLTGLLLLFFGLNGFFQFMVPPEGSAAGMAFFSALMAAGYMMPFINILMLATGAMLLLNFKAAFAAVLIAPLTVSVILFHVFLDPATSLFAAILAILNVLLGAMYWDKYAPMFE
jgi:putative oxidoreductase